MTSTVERIILAPRHTALYGAATFKSPAVWVRPYSQALVSVWRSQGYALSSFSALVQESVDQEIWTTAGTISPAADAESTDTITLQKDWMRIELDVTGTGAAVTCWAVADLVLREEHGA